jgi:hypothetical protein
MPTNSLNQRRGRFWLICKIWAVLITIMSSFNCKENCSESYKPFAVIIKSKRFYFTKNSTQVGWLSSQKERSKYLLLSRQKEKTLLRKPIPMHPSWFYKYFDNSFVLVKCLWDQTTTRKNIWRRWLVSNLLCASILLQSIPKWRMHWCLQYLGLIDQSKAVMSKRWLKYSSLSIPQIRRKFFNPTNERVNPYKELLEDS